MGEYTGSQKDMTQTVIFATVQSISKDLEKFSPMDFDYLIVDECHHAAANTYQKIFTYFHPKFILGLTATPERSDGEDKQIPHFKADFAFLYARFGVRKNA